MQLGETLYVHLIDDRPLPRCLRFARRPPGEGRVDHAALLHEGGAVAIVERLVLVGMIHAVAKQLWSPFQLADELLGIGIDDELVRIEAMPSVGIERTVDTIGIDGARSERRQVAMPDFIGILRKLDALEFL